MSPQQVVLPWPGLADPARLSAGASRAHRGWRVCPRDRRRPGAPARPGRHADAVFELVEGPPGARPQSRARASSTRACRCGCSTSRGTGSAGRRSSGFAGAIDIAHSLHPLLMPARARGPGRDDPRSRFPRSPRAHARGDPAGLRARWRRLTRGAPIAVDHDLAVHGRRDRPASRRRRATASSSARPARRRGRRGRAARAGADPVHGHARTAKEFGALLDAYAKLWQMVPDAPPLWLAGGVTRGGRAWLRAIAEPPLAGHVAHLGYVAGRAPVRSLCAARRCWCCRRTWKASA